MGIEGNPEFNRLRGVIKEIVVPGAGRDELEQLLTLEPQRDADGNLRYLVTSGMAVALMTGYKRKYCDLDLVIMDPANVDYWELYGTDNVTPRRYLAHMIFDPDLLRDTARTAYTQWNHGVVVEYVHPAILMVQKSSNVFGWAPRPKDVADVKAIVRLWKTSKQFTTKWDDIARAALFALPPNQIEITLERLSFFMGNGRVSSHVHKPTNMHTQKIAI